MFSWLVNYSWTSMARIRLDPDVDGNECIFAAPHRLKIDVRSYVEAVKRLSSLDRTSFLLKLMYN